MAETRIRERRRTCYWEEIYAPDLVGKLAAGGWDFTHDKGPTKKFFEASSLTKFMSDGKGRVFKGVVFTNCDFQGHFVHDAQIIFNECQFLNCDFSLTTLENIKFSSCNFNNVSFGQSIIRNCEFRSCIWGRIALSPNATELYDTYISNPMAFISAASTNLDPAVMRKNNKNPLEQKLRLENTKATISRRIYKMLQQEGGEDSYYESVKTFLLQNATSEMASATLKRMKSDNYLKKIVCLLKWFIWLNEREIIRLFGFINRWGASVTRPMIFMFFSFLLFNFLYKIGIPSYEASSVQRSFDITILAGYSIYYQESNLYIKICQNIQVVISIIFYSLFFATVINRVSRVR